MKKILALPIASMIAVLGAASATANPVELGALFSFSGTASGSIYDKDIHSGVFRNANGTSSDSYVLQGGDPYGGDTGDGFEVTQSDGVAFVNGFQITTSYAFGNPSSQVGTFITGGPDTGVVNFKNTTASVFIGTLTLSGYAQGGIYGPAQLFSNSGTVTLNPGESANILLNYESSNFGGYNHPDAEHTTVPDSGSTVVLFAGGIAFLAAARRKLFIEQLSPA